MFTYSYSNPLDAIKWLKKLVMLNEASAGYMLMGYYLDGKIVEKNIHDAAMWARISTDQIKNDPFSWILYYFNKVQNKANKLDAMNTVQSLCTEKPHSKASAQTIKISPEIEKDMPEFCKIYRSINQDDINKFMEISLK